MDQIEKLFSALSPASIALVLEQVDVYKCDFDSEDGTEEDQQEIAWCDRIREIGTEAIASKK